MVRALPAPRSRPESRPGALGSVVIVMSGASGCPAAEQPGPAAYGLRVRARQVRAAIPSVQRGGRRRQRGSPRCARLGGSWLVTDQHRRLYPRRGHGLVPTRARGHAWRRPGARGGSPAAPPEQRRVRAVLIAASGGTARPPLIQPGCRGGDRPSATAALDHREQSAEPRRVAAPDSSARAIVQTAPPPAASPHRAVARTARSSAAASRSASRSAPPLSGRPPPRRLARPRGRPVSSATSQISSTKPRQPVTRAPPRSPAQRPRRSQRRPARTDTGRAISA